jgi:hypothetical protein
VDVNRLIERSFSLEHRHSDGRWESLKPRAHHDASDHDPERGWDRGRIFVCPSCDEQVRVVSPTAEDHPQG